jgi:hypothetical protein
MSIKGMGVRDAAPVVGVSERELSAKMFRINFQVMIGDIRVSSEYAKKEGFMFDKKTKLDNGMTVIKPMITGLGICQLKDSFRADFGSQADLMAFS